MWPRGLFSIFAFHTRNPVCINTTEEARTNPRDPAGVVWQRITPVWVSNREGQWDCASNVGVISTSSSEVDVLLGQLIVGRRVQSKAADVCRLISPSSCPSPSHVLPPPNTTSSNPSPPSLRSFPCWPVFLPCSRLCSDHFFPSMTLL